MNRNKSTLTVAQQQLYTELTRDILRERIRQIQKFGTQAATPLRPPVWAQCPGGKVVVSEADAKRACDESFAAGVGTWAHIIGEEVAESFDAMTEAEMRVELIQLAACCFGAIEALDFQRSVRAQAAAEGTSSGPGEVT